MEGVGKKEEIKEIRRNAIRAGLQLVDCPIRHLGTEKAQEIYLAIEHYLLENGVEMLFGCECEDVLLQNDRCLGVSARQGAQSMEIFAKHTVIATGRRGADWLEQLCADHNIAHEPGTVDIGVRVEVRNEIMLPSCVPAAGGEENGAVLHADALRPYYANPRVLGLGEVMNVPGVLDRDPDLTRKLCDAANAGKHVDGHAPGLRGANLCAYLAAGISTDHECSTVGEAREKLRRGMTRVRISAVRWGLTFKASGLQCISRMRSSSSARAKHITASAPKNGWNPYMMQTAM